MRGLLLLKVRKDGHLDTRTFGSEMLERSFFK